MQRAIPSVSSARLFSQERQQVSRIGGTSEILSDAAAEAILF